MSRNSDDKYDYLHKIRPKKLIVSHAEFLFKLAAPVQVEVVPRKNRSTLKLLTF
ncbi:hypothetical protein D1BOALGB6SA_7989 [Olavius sp. associated proteobacterium Delta 1]|nr:hypothetical protein D1BOALGB6SA_7989 [Olavius sp. associated proteobacterium Delta 1]